MNDTLTNPGVLVINKEQGFTSHDCVNIVRRLTGIKKAGHTGTLDPEATGVLPVFLGKATRAIQYVDDREKIYLFKLMLGKRSDTFDIWGEIQPKTTVEEAALKEIKREDIEKALKHFLGDIKQVPPIYSSIKKKGKPLYKYARAGIEVEVPPRNVRIEELELLDYDDNKKEATLRVQCSKGTYIRSLCNDMGNLLETGGLMSYLVREANGQFKLVDSFKLSEINNEQELLKRMIPLNKVLLNLGTIMGTKDDFEALKDGKALTIKENSIIRTNEEGIYFIEYENNVISIGKLTDLTFKPDKVLI
ncbi:MAG: tRNA pseudouridine(55) synthase TruB [Anaerovoracaceae bacterium]